MRISCRYHDMNVKLMPLLVARGCGWWGWQGWYDCWDAGRVVVRGPGRLTVGPDHDVW